MPFARVQQAGQSGVGGGTSIGQTFAGPVTLGNTVTVDVCWGDDATAPTSVSDTLGNVYTAATAVIQDATNLQYQQAYVAPVTVAGTPTITATFGTLRQFRAIILTEYSGAHPTAPFDVGGGQLQTAPGAGTDAVTSGLVTPSQNNSLIHGAVQNTNDPTTTFAAGTGFALGFATTGQITTSEWLEQATAAPIAATFTASAGTRTLTTVVVLKPSGAGVVPPVAAPLLGSLFVGRAFGGGMLRSSTGARINIRNFTVPSQTIASGTIYDDAVTESLTATEAIAATVDAQGTDAESLAAADSATATRDASVALTESVTASDAQVGAVALSVACAETLAASDAQTATVTTAGAVAEALNAADAQVGGIAIAAAISETLTAVESETGIIALSGAVADTLAASDAQTGTVGAAGARTESLAAVDAESATTSLGAACTESVTAAETQAATVIYGVAVADAVAASDGPSATRTLPATWADALAASDAVIEGAIVADAIATLIGSFTQILTPVTFSLATPTVTLAQLAVPVTLSLASPPIR